MRQAVSWQNHDGAIIDPVEGVEHGQSSPRFVAPAAILLAAGRIKDLYPAVRRGMSWCAQRLAAGKAQSPDFWMRELVTAYSALEPLADTTDRRNWRHLLRQVNPEKHFASVERPDQPIQTLRNWTVYAAAGEAMRQQAGLVPPAPTFRCGNAFFDYYMPHQFHWFSEYGMYRDPADPITYDITTRLQIACALAAGYQGPLRRDFSEILRRGGLTQLLFLSPDGLVPFGGRSSQFHFQEAIISALCELEAQRYAPTDPQLAGAFKRQAHLSARSVQRWLVGMTPFRHLKQFSPALPVRILRDAEANRNGFYACLQLETSGSAISAGAKLTAATTDQSSK